MKVTILSIEGKKLATIDLPSQFNEHYHPDIINRANTVIRSNKRQKYAALKTAGTRPSISLSRRRHVYKTTYGYGISRVPRKALSGQGSRFNWVGAFAPGTVSGRRAHPPKAEKIWGLKINKKERRKAIRSALAATTIKELVQGNFNNDLPLVVEAKLEDVSQTKNLVKTLNKLGLQEIIESRKEKKIRAGKGKTRGRKYKRKLGPLLVVSGKCKLESAASNIPGLDIVQVKQLNTAILSHGNKSRLTIYTDKALNTMKEENLFS